MLKSELIKAMKDMPDDAPVILSNEGDGSWDNIEKVEMNMYGTMIHIMFGMDDRREADDDYIRCDHDGFAWVWDMEKKIWLLDVERSGGPPSPFEPSPEPPQFNPEDEEQA